MNHIADLNARTRPDLVTSLDTESDAFLLAAMMDKRAHAVEIERQLTEDAAAGYLRGEVWRSKARRACRHFRTDAATIQRQLDHRRVQRDQDIKMTRAKELGKAQETQHALFVRYMSTTMPKEQWAALWAAVRAAFPNDRAWLNGKPPA